MIYSHCRHHRHYRHYKRQATVGAEDKTLRIRLSVCQEPINAFLAPGSFYKWRYPHSRMVFVRENPNKEWMMI